MLPRPAVSALFVCSSDQMCAPAAVAIARSLLAARGISSVMVDAAGTVCVRRGELPHPVAVAEGARRGHPLVHRARPIHPDDFADFDLIVAMNQRVVDELRRLGGSTDERISSLRALEPVQVQLVRRWDPYGMPGDEDLLDPTDLAAEMAHARLPDRVSAMFDVLERSIPALVDHLLWLTEDVVRELP